MIEREYDQSHPISHARLVVEFREMMRDRARLAAQVACHFFGSRALDTEQPDDLFLAFGECAPNSLTAFGQRVYPFAMEVREFEGFSMFGPSREVVFLERTKIKGQRVRWRLTLSCGHVATIDSTKPHNRKSMRCGLCGPSALHVLESKRNIAIHASRQHGESLSTIGARYGLSIERVRQIHKSLARVNLSAKPAR
jgi:Sigma-70, region 4